MGVARFSLDCAGSNMARVKGSWVRLFAVTGYRAWHDGWLVVQKELFWARGALSG